MVGQIARSGRINPPRTRCDGIALVGSCASMAYGEFRMPQDVDILVEISPDRIEEFCHRFPASDWYVSTAAAAEAVRSGQQFKVIHIPSGNKLDFMLPRQSTWGTQQLDRRQQGALLPNRPIYAAHPEDIIVGKLLYYREGASDQHLRDIAGILNISGELIDRQRATQWTDTLGIKDVWDIAWAQVHQAEQEWDRFRICSPLLHRHSARQQQRLLDRQVVQVRKAVFLFTANHLRHVRRIRDISGELRKLHLLYPLSIFPARLR